MSCALEAKSPIYDGFVAIINNRKTKDADADATAEVRE